ncbi:uncharacterized protein BT62DRAFT_929006 [Guyanagaster necrorhizus]|uniref:Uncharacterized protein n=1 Tax=Guyanagaster necrorhizus TaxID=856835 RepID=A0A9P7VXF1_9AGAR|nr:uncharacterized protein BT62DRAFT_929006 [Guyanagaster necrorhizus MCA 3950]KAG7449008.1 hypothetical protein BT62DRAFT_929006 [Guyanagaster necrorhizus MCA 3950]
MSSRKRARDEFDDDEPTFGRQILPVANLPADFHGTPADGMEYLFTVRRDAKRLPMVTRVPNPYEIPDMTTPSASGRDSSSGHPSLPSTEWRARFETRFKNFRKNVSQPTASVQLPQVPGNLLIPSKKERDFWWAFLSGKPESEWNPPKKPKQNKKLKGMRAFTDDSDAEITYEAVQETWQINKDGDVELASQVRSSSVHGPADEAKTLDNVSSLGESPPPSYKPRPLTPSLLQHIDQRMSLHLLMYFTHWINLHLDDERSPPFPRLAEVHAQWIFFLLTRVEDYISADDMSSLRSLARACLALLKVLLYEEKEARPKDSGIGKNSCWIIISTVAGIWGQQDLWMDAEGMLNSIGPK